MNELNLKKCSKCGKIVNVMTYNNQNIMCCNEIMLDIKSNITECAIEKHIPSYKIINDKILVEVNHVMEEDHYISFITLVKNNLEITKYLNDKLKAEVEFPYLKDATLYAYCNKHGLWKTNVD